ncbi:MAG TPA: PQQ-binding-like beta-propeller repeat protein [Acidobacteriaceae bacterium]|nr:PQQ-binding-like beta-propeller repeat protein [Acidobacteriaceae bacterium]
MPGIFINYRREDSGGYAQQIYKALRSHFGAKLVFMDIDTIRSGEDYRAIIHESIAQSDVFLAIIGRTWLRCTDDKGIARLSYPTDLVRREIAQALEANIHVVPVLVGHAQMPRAADLPDDLKALSVRNAHEIPDHFFDPSVRQLIQTIRPHVRGKKEISRRAVIYGLGGTATVVLAAAIADGVFKHRVPLPEQSRTTTLSAADLKIDEKFDEIEAMLQQAAKQPSVVIRKPGYADSLPPDVPGPWKIDRIDFSSQVTGPHREPKVVWSSRVSIGNVWQIAGFAPDRTVFLYDEIQKVLCALRDGVEQWAYTAEQLRAFTPGGLVVLQSLPLSMTTESFICINSQGQGGIYKRPAKLPQNLIRLPELTYASVPGICQSGSVTIPRSKAVLALDGNCSSWNVVRDDQGRLYSGTDRGTLYCLDEDGKTLWTYKAEAPIDHPPLFSLGDAVITVKDRLICVREGVKRWSVSLESCRAWLVDKTGTVFASSDGPRVMGHRSQNNVSAVDHDGHILWSTLMAGTPASLDPEGRLYMADTSIGSFVICLA